MSVKSLIARYKEADVKYQSLYKSLTKMVKNHIDKRELKANEAADKARDAYEASLAGTANAEAINYLREQLETVRDIRIKLKKELNESLVNDLDIAVRVE